jgi:hypothetical protein
MKTDIGAVMYCSTCGAAFPLTSNFCPQCGKPALKADPIHGWQAVTTVNRVATANAASDLISANDTETAAGREADLQEISIAPPNPNSMAATNTSTATFSDPGRPKYANSGSIVLTVFSLLCLIFGVMQGFIPIFLIAAIIFGGLAALCAFRWPLSISIHSVVLTTSLLLAGVVGIALGRDPFGPSYRYLTQGNTEIRINEKNGRTDRLTNGGWEPIAFDHNAMQLPQDENSKITLSNGVWKSNYLSGEVCFDVSNSSDYVVKSIAIVVTAKDKSGNEVKDLSDDPFSLYTSNGPSGTMLTSTYGLLNTGGSYHVCGNKSRALADGEIWSYTGMQAWGWKK